MAFEAWIARIKSRDPLVYEDAFHAAWPRGPGFVAGLVAELRRAADAYTRGKLIEILGETRAPDAAPVLARELAHPDPIIRRWAVHALRTIGGAEAAAAILRHGLRRPGGVA